MMIKLVIASNNLHKISEIKAILNQDFVQVFAYRDVIDTHISPIEDGQTFAENAIIKVSAFPSIPGYTFLAEDSGIEVAHLKGKPGIHSARYAGQNATREDMCAKLLNDCQHATNRKAQYQAAMAIRFPDHPIQTVTGVVTGSLTDKIRGENGFGYDPIFQPTGYDLTFGEMDSETKNKLSHRYNALRQIKSILEKYSITHSNGTVEK